MSLIDKILHRRGPADLTIPRSLYHRALLRIGVDGECVRMAVSQTAHHLDLIARYDALRYRNLGLPVKIKRSAWTTTPILYLRNPRTIGVVGWEELDGSISVDDYFTNDQINDLRMALNNGELVAEAAKGSHDS